MSKYLSRSVQDYLKAIYSMAQHKAGLIQTTEIADRLTTSPASVTDMIKKLAAKDLVDYTPYKGVKLTKPGLKVATELIRSHRLWEVFLVEKLGYDWGDVHEIAEQLEHVVSDDLTDRLAAFLGHPSYDPHGDPIPDAQGRYRLSNRVLLSQLPRVDGLVKVQGLKTHTQDFTQYLDQLGIVLGTQLDLQGINAFDKSIRAQIAGTDLLIPASIASNLYVSTIQ